MTDGDAFGWKAFANSSPALRTNCASALVRLTVWLNRDSLFNRTFEGRQSVLPPRFHGERACLNQHGVDTRPNCVAITELVKIAVIFG